MFLPCHTLLNFLFEPIFCGIGFAATKHVPNFPPMQNFRFGHNAHHHHHGARRA
jgi:hypothetical protein